MFVTDARTVKRLVSLIMVATIGGLAISCTSTRSLALKYPLPNLAPSLETPTPDATTAADFTANKVAKSLDPAFPGSAVYSSQQESIAVDSRWKPPAACRFNQRFSGTMGSTYDCGRNRIFMWNSTAAYDLPFAIPVGAGWQPSDDCRLGMSDTSSFQMRSGGVVPLFNIYICNSGLIAAPSGIGYQLTPALEKAARADTISIVVNGAQSDISAESDLQLLDSASIDDLPDQAQAALAFTNGRTESIRTTVEKYCESTEDFLGSKSLPGTIYYRDGPLGSTYVAWIITACKAGNDLSIVLKVSEDASQVWWLNNTGYLSAPQPGSENEKKH